MNSNLPSTKSQNTTDTSNPITLPINKEKKKQYNETQKKRLNGTLAQPLIHQAKQALTPPLFDINLVLAQEAFQTLTIDDIKLLKESARQKLKYWKKNPEKSLTHILQKNEEVKNSTDGGGSKIPTPVLKLKSYIQHYTDKLLQANEHEDRLKLLTLWNMEEHLSLVDYLSTMSHVPDNLPNFLESLCEIINNDENLDQQLRLLLCICCLYSKPTILPIQHSLFVPLLNFIVAWPEVKSAQGIGFLKAAFCNNISLVGSDAKSLREFDFRFGKYIDAFYINLYTQLKLNKRPFLVLPRTCFFLSKPIIKYLTADTEKTAFLPIDYYHYFMEVLVYTFTDNVDHAEIYLQTLKGHLKHWERIKSSNYDFFLGQFIKCLTEQDPRWFGKLDAVTRLINDTLILVTEKKVTNFTVELADQIVKDESIIQDLFQRVSAMDKSSQDDQINFLKQTIQFNNFNNSASRLLNKLDISLPLNKYHQIIFKEWGLDSINEQQLILCKLMDHEKFLIVNPGLGMGKSTFIQFQSIYQAVNEPGSIIIILNSDSTLLFRDYSKVNFIVQQLEDKYKNIILPVEFIENYSHFQKAQHSQILFMQPNVFLQCSFDEQFQVMIDECHRDLLESHAAPLIKKLRQSQRLFATTGTFLSKAQLLFLQAKFKGTSVRFQDTYSHNCDYKMPNICINEASHINNISKLVKQEVQAAPIIIILNEEIKEKLLAKFKSNKCAIISLFGKDITDVEANHRIVNDFNKQNTAGSWNCYLINQKQGTGTDFPSHPEIEMNGGIRVIIAVEPTSYAELCQFQRRTARINNKGRVFYIINKSQTKFRGATQDYLASITKQLKAQTDLDIKKALREITKTFTDEDNEMVYIMSDEDQNDTNIQHEVLSGQDNEEEIKGEEQMECADRDMCSFCFGEIYLGGPVHICDSTLSNNKQQQMEYSAGKQTIIRSTHKEDKVNQEKETPKYSNPLLQKLAEKPKVKKFGQNEQNSLGFQPSGKRSTRKYDCIDSEEESKKRQKIE